MRMRICRIPSKDHLLVCGQYSSIRRALRYISTQISSFASFVYGRRKGLYKMYFHYKTAVNSGIQIDLNLCSRKARKTRHTTIYELRNGASRLRSACNGVQVSDVAAGRVAHRQ